MILAFSLPYSSLLQVLKSATFRYSPRYYAVYKVRLRLEGILPEKFGDERCQ